MAGLSTQHSLRKALGAIKDSTKVGLAKVNSTYKDLDIAVVKATNHVECPPKEKHVRSEQSDLVKVVDPDEIYVEVVVISLLDQLCNAVAYVF
jgi:hypothetical protein